MSLPQSDCGYCMAAACLGGCQGGPCAVNGRRRQTFFGPRSLGPFVQVLKRREDKSEAEDNREKGEYLGFAMG